MNFSWIRKGWAARISIGLLSLALFASGLVSTCSADIIVGVDPSKTWNGYMNVFNLNRPSSGLPTKGDYQFGSPWGFSDLVFGFSGSTLSLGVNNIGDPSNYWYIGGGGPGSLGNKWMDANGYVEVSDGSLSGVNLTFTGSVLSNTFTPNHTARVFIRDFSADFSSVVETSAVLGSGAFSISLATTSGVGRHVQYGFSVQGENVWVTDIAPFGKVQIQAVPEPSSLLALTSLGTVGLISRRRRR